MNCCELNGATTGRYGTLLYPGKPPYFLFDNLLERRSALLVLFHSLSQYFLAFNELGFAFAETKFSS